MSIDFEDQLNFKTQICVYFYVSTYIYLCTYFRNVGTLRETIVLPEKRFTTSYLMIWADELYDLMNCEKSVKSLFVITIANFFS